MNRKQKLYLLAGVIAVVLMGLYPPWIIQTRELNLWGGSGKYKYTLEPGPYRWIGSPPQRDYPGPSSKDRPSNYWDGDRAKLYWWERPRFIDLYRLGVQYFVVAVVTTGLIIICNERKKSQTA